MLVWLASGVNACSVSEASCANVYSGYESGNLYSDVIMCLYCGSLSCFSPSTWFTLVKNGLKQKYYYFIIIAVLTVMPALIQIAGSFKYFALVCYLSEMRLVLDANAGFLDKTQNTKHSSGQFIQTEPEQSF